MTAWREANDEVPESSCTWTTNLRRNETILLSRLATVGANDCHEIQVIARIPNPLLEVRVVAVLTADLLSKHGAYCAEKLMILEFTVSRLLE